MKRISLLQRRSNNHSRYSWFVGVLTLSAQVLMWGRNLWLLGHVWRRISICVLTEKNKQKTAFALFLAEQVFFSSAVTYRWFVIPFWDKVISAVFSPPSLSFSVKRCWLGWKLSPRWWDYFLLSKARVLGKWTKAELQGFSSRVSDRVSSCCLVFSP